MIKVKKLHPDATFEKAHDIDSGYDLTAVDWVYKENGLFHIKLGVAIEPPPGYYFDLVPRSSFSKTGFIFVNNVGVIDEGYRGEWMFPIRYLADPLCSNFSKRFVANKIIDDLIWTKIAQAILRKRHDMPVEFIDKLSETKRGEGGFGSTGA